MKKAALFFSWFFLFITLFFSAKAEVEITAKVDKVKITNEDEISLLVTIKGNSNTSEPVLPSLPAFNVVSSGKSSSIQIINGNTSISKQYQYILVPNEDGTFTIGPITVTSEGKTYATKPITVIVGYVSAPSNQNGANPIISNPNNKDYWMTAEVTNTSPYVNEQILYIFRFYTKVPVSRALLTTPSFKDFWFEEVVPEKKYEHDVNGEKYVVSEKRVALFPIKSGKYKIDETMLDLYVQNTNNPFNNPYYGTKAKLLKSKPITIDVKTLPAPAPDNFINFVGRTLHVASKISSNSGKTGESLTLELVFRGNGDINDILLPEKIDLGPFKRYDDKPTSETTRKEEGIEGTKNFTVSLIPTTAGNLKVGPLVFSYFDPEEKKYKTISTDTFALNIEQGDEPVAEESHPDKNKEDPSLKKPENKGPGLIERIKIPEFAWDLLVFFSLLFPFLFVGTYIVQKVRGFKNDPERKKYKALKNFRKNTKKLSKENILNAVRIYFAERFDLAPTLSSEELSAFIEANFGESRAYLELLETVRNLEASLYGGTVFSMNDSKLANVVYKNLKTVDSTSIKPQKLLSILFFTCFFPFFNVNAAEMPTFIEPEWVSFGKKIFFVKFIPFFDKIVFLFLVLWVFFFFFSWISLLKRKNLFKTKWILLFLTLYMGFNAFFRYYTDKIMEWGVISGNNVAVYSSFMEEEATLGHLNEGTRVLIQYKRTFENKTVWVQVYWSPEKSGWIKEENLVRRDNSNHD